MIDDLMSKSITHLSKLLRSKKISSVDLVNYYFDRIEKFDNQIHAFLSTDKKLAIKQAKESDNKIKEGDQSLLTGIPYMLKDNICTNNFPTTAGSKILNNFYSNYDATVVKKLNKAGAVIIGKGNLDEGWVVKVYYNPLVIWIWIGAIFVFLGGIISINNNLSTEKNLYK